MSDNGFYPSGFISLRKAIQRVAAAMGEPISNSDFERLDRHLSAVREGRSQSYYSHGFVHEDVLRTTRDETIKPILSRHQRAAEQFRRMAYGEPPLTVALNADGVPEQLGFFWGKSAAGRMLEEGIDTWTDEFGRFEGGPVLVDDKRLTALLDKGHRVRPPSPASSMEHSKDRRRNPGGRPKGSGAIDDTERLERMEKLIQNYRASGTIISVTQAAIEIVAEEKGPQGSASAVSRLARKFREKQKLSA
jgi:hypothetical protein